MHNGDQDFYLRASTGTYSGVATDDGSYCTDVCHNNKTVAALGTASTSNGHLWAINGVDAGPRGECYLCHFIQDGSTRGANPRADINALMRVEPVNMPYADVTADTDVNDYEDMCYGCHSSTSLSNGTGTTGSTIDTLYFTHRYASTPSAGVATNIAAAVGLVLANNTTTGGGLSGEYGAVQTAMYCGTCHNVHVQNSSDLQGQMFRRVNNTAANNLARLCIDCHGASGMAAGKSHPTYVDAGYDTDMPSVRTASPIPSQFGAGGDGVAGGRTGGSTPGGTTASGNMSCETCHNFHAANTDMYGNITDSGTVENKGKLLVQDNNATAVGSDMCRNCHGGNY
jgi:hypothetical protein